VGRVIHAELTTIKIIYLSFIIYVMSFSIHVEETETFIAP